MKLFTALLLALTAMPISAVADTDANTLKAVLSTSTQQTTKKQQERTTAKQNRQDAKAQSDAERNYNKDIDKIIDAYNTVTKKIYSKCVADGISIEDCKNK